MEKNSIKIVLFLLLVALFCLVEQSSAQIRHEVFLPNTDHELHVYRIFGDEPGKTLMIIGGIQGDEPGGYMTADLYADIHLKKGNLIVVPRANFYSILLNRREGLTGDMNRKFSPDGNGGKRSLEEEVVTILKHLIAESDCLLNLHEGSGYYNPDYVSDIENPLRYGQSIIFDSRIYDVPGENRKIYLEEIAKRVVNKANESIENKRYQFKVNNHDTLSEDSSHKEQRKSATYYALTFAHIPGFGIETSKSIRSLTTKITLQKLIINAAMEEFGIELDSPGVTVDPPALQYLLIKVNGGYPYALPHGSTLEVEMGDDVVITDIVANYQRGLVADVEGFGSTNDTNKPFRVSETTKVIVRKDAGQCGWVVLEPKRTPVKAASLAEKKEIPLSQLTAEQLFVDVDGALKKIDNRRILTVSSGSRITMQSIRTNIARYDKDIVVNFKGFAPPKNVNDGNDLLFPIYTDQDLWQRYSVKKDGKKYPIHALYKEKIIGKFWVELQ